MKEGNKFSGRIIYGIFMAVFYLLISMAFIFTSVFNSFVENYTLRIAIGVVLIAYSVMRGIRAWREFKN